MGLCLVDLLFSGCWLVVVLVSMFQVTVVWGEVASCCRF